MMLGWTMRRYLLGLVVGLFCSAAPAPAILIEVNDGKKTEKVGGFLVRDDDTILIIRIRTADDREQDIPYPLAKITILHRLDVKRLGNLSRDDPKGYRDYAEKLAGEKNDPEAIHTAMRLYLIAAYLNPKEFGSSSLLAMSKLASKPAEARRCRALAFLLDPKASDEILKAVVAKPPPLDKAQIGALENFTRALQLYRAGRIPEAKTMVNREGVDQIFGKTPFKIDKKTFLQWCDNASCTTCNRLSGLVLCPKCNGKKTVTNMFGQPERCPTCNARGGVLCPDCGGRHVRDPLPEEDMRVTLRCELWALDQLGGEETSRKETANAKGWSAVLKEADRLSPVSRLSLETVTDIDPRKSRYRSGKWVEE